MGRYITELRKPARRQVLAEQLSLGGSKQASLSSTIKTEGAGGYLEKKISIRFESKQEKLRLNTPVPVGKMIRVDITKELVS
jgi:hypothetical protein